LSLTAIAERIAKRNDLHRNAQDRGVSASEKELRKRLWWQIILLDSRAAGMSAVGTSILSFTWNTKLPLNVNESDSSSEMGVLPQGHKRTTDMTFCLIRCEIAEFLRQIRATRVIDVKWGEFGNPSVPLADKLVRIHDFEQHLHTKYLNYCDPQNPPSCSRSLLCQTLNFENEDSCIWAIDGHGKARKPHACLPGSYRSLQRMCYQPLLDTFYLVSDS
jgi:hypothetical protein